MVQDTFYGITWRGLFNTVRRDTVSDLSSADRVSMRDFRTRSSGQGLIRRVANSLRFAAISCWPPCFAQCGVTYSLTGPTASNTATPAQLATAEAAVAAANAVTAASGSSSGSSPLLAGSAPPPASFSGAEPQLRVRTKAGQGAGSGSGSGSGGKTPYGKRRAEPRVRFSPNKPRRSLSCSSPIMSRAQCLRDSVFAFRR